MKTYATCFGIAAALISLPSAFLLVVNLYNGNHTPALIFAAFLLLFWGLYLLLRAEKRFAFAVSMAVSVVLWTLLLYRTIERVGFVLENGGMERADGFGSPLAFLLGLATEQMFFVPLSLVLAVGLKQVLRTQAHIKLTIK